MPAHDTPIVTDLEGLFDARIGRMTLTEPVDLHDSDGLLR
jgi:hypothetical protein